MDLPNVPLVIGFHVVDQQMRSSGGAINRGTQSCFYFFDIPRWMLGESIVENSEHREA